MVINWFPGHMTKALRTMQKEIKNIDCVVYVVDARAPFACLNPEFDKLIAGKATLVGHTSATLRLGYGASGKCFFHHTVTAFKSHAAAQTGHRIDDQT